MRTIRSLLIALAAAPLVASLNVQGIAIGAAKLIEAMIVEPLAKMIAMSPVIERSPNA